MSEELLSDVKELSEEAVAWLKANDIEYVDDLTTWSKSELAELPDYDIYHVWDIEDVLDTRGLTLLPDRDRSKELGLITLQEWVRRLAEICPHASSLTLPQTKDLMRKQGYDMEMWEGALPPSQFKDVLGRLAQIQPEWLYYSDWKWSRDDAARVFEGWLGLPEKHLSPEPDLPLSMLPGDANRAADELGTSEDFVYTIPPYDDDFVFMKTSDDLRNALIAAYVLAPDSVEDFKARGELPLTLDASMSLYETDAFAIDAQNLFQNMALRTVGDLLEKSFHELQKRNSETGVVEHIDDVLKRAGLRLSY